MKHIVLFLALIVLVHSVWAQSADELYNDALSRFEEGDYYTCTQQINKALTLDPGNYDYLLLRGACFEKNEEWGEAMRIYSMSIEIDKKRSAAYSDRARIFMFAGKDDIAIKDLLKAISYAENDSLKATYLTEISSAYITIREFEKALTALTESYEILPDNIATLNNLGWAYYETGHPEEAFLFLEQAFHLDPTRNYILINLGFFHQREGNYENSMFFLNEALKNEPECASCYNNLGYCKMKTGDLKGALADINKSIKLLPANAYAYRNRGLVYLELKKKKKACADFDKALDLGFTKQYGEEVNELRLRHCK